MLMTVLARFVRLPAVWGRSAVLFRFLATGGMLIVCETLFDVVAVGETTPALWPDVADEVAVEEAFVVTAF